MVVESAFGYGGDIFQRKSINACCVFFRKYEGKLYRKIKTRLDFFLD